MACESELYQYGIKNLNKINGTCGIGMAFPKHVHAKLWYSNEFLQRLQYAVFKDMYHKQGGLSKRSILKFLSTNNIQVSNSCTRARAREKAFYTLKHQYKTHFNQAIPQFVHVGNLRRIGFCLNILKTKDVYITTIYRNNFMVSARDVSPDHSQHKAIAKLLNFNILSELIRHHASQEYVFNKFKTLYNTKVFYCTHPNSLSKNDVDYLDKQTLFAMDTEGHYTKQNLPCAKYIQIGDLKKIYIFKLNPENIELLKTKCAQMTVICWDAKCDIPKLCHLGITFKDFIDVQPQTYNRRLLSWIAHCYRQKFKLPITLSPKTTKFYQDFILDSELTLEKIDYAASDVFFTYYKYLSIEK